jgi:MerR-like DNA binding protein
VRHPVKIPGSDAVLVNRVSAMSLIQGFDSRDAIQLAIWVRELKPSLSRIWPTCVATVRSEMNSWAAICLLLIPRAMSSLDLRLDEIGDVIDLQLGGAQPHQTVLGLLDRHMADIDRTLTDLRALRRSLVSARSIAKTSSQDGDDAVICQIVASQG